MVKVKICGNTNESDVMLAREMGADYLGFIFAESKRRVDPASAREMMAALPDFKNFVGVFCNQAKQEVERIVRALGLKILQFHGEETALYCEYFTSQGFEVIKTFRIKDAMSLKRIDEYNASAFLFDTYAKEESGGTGVPFDWNLIDERPFVREKLFLAGGLNPTNVRQAIEKVRPFAVDVASGVEMSPGKKDAVLLKQFLQAAKETKIKSAAKSPLRP